MALPNFLSPAELTALLERAVKARDEVNVIVAQLGTASELNLLPKFRDASGALYKAINNVRKVAEERSEGVPADPRLVKAIFGENSPEYKQIAEYLAGEKAAEYLADEARRFEGK